jgi:hypothetical protein
MYKLISTIRAAVNILSAEIPRQLKQSLQQVELSQFVVHEQSVCLSPSASLRTVLLFLFYAVEETGSAVSLPVVALGCHRFARV